MKKIKTVLIITCLHVIITGLFSQGVAINNDGSAPNSSAILDIKSTSLGVLFPRMTKAQRDAISSPVAGLVIFNTDNKLLEIYDGTVWTSITGEIICGKSTLEHGGFSYGTVKYNGQCWLDRNLGATQAAASVTDPNSYGHLYQWGRLTDGHQVPTSGTTSTISSSSTPGHGNFILSNSSPYDWLNPQNNNLWNSASNYLNNPCPVGWRLPSNTEWFDAAQNWNNISDAFNSPLRISAAGYRLRTNGSLKDQGDNTYIWTSGVTGANAISMYLNPSTSGLGGNNRAHGFSVRCILDEQ